MSKKTWGIAAVIATATLLSPLVVATSAEAAEKSLGNITCAGQIGQFPEIHTLSTSKGDTVHSIYGAWQRVQAWPVTSSITAGYSSSYSSWDVHHWLYYKNGSGGRVTGSSGVSSVGMQCR